MVKTSGHGPPGTSTFNVEPVFSPGNESEEFVEVLDSLPLGAMLFEEYDSPSAGSTDTDKSAGTVDSTEIQEEWKRHYPYWAQDHTLSRMEIGDCYAMVAEAALATQQPYPGDEIFERNRGHPDHRFRILRRLNDREYIICDRLMGVRTSISRSLLEQPRFDISRWYAARQIHTLILDRKITQHLPMGLALKTVATKLLTDGITTHYPCVRPDLDPGRRFTLYPPRPGREDAYTIRDADLDLLTHVSRAQLENPRFNLVEWYRLHLDRANWYERRYYDLHLRLYRSPRVSQQPHTCGCEPHEKETCPVEPTARRDENIRKTNLRTSLPPLPPDLDPCWDELPDLVSVSSEDEEDFDEEQDDLPMFPVGTLNIDIVITRIQEVLSQCQPFPGDHDGQPVDRSFDRTTSRFLVDRQDKGLYCIYDRLQGFEVYIHSSRVHWTRFAIGAWFAQQCAVNSGEPYPWKRSHQWMLKRKWEDTIMGFTLEKPPHEYGDEEMEPVAGKGPESTTTDDPHLELSGVQVDRHKYHALQRNAAQIKGQHQVLPKPLVIRVTVDGHPARALLDSGSLGDFMSTTLADQLGVKRTLLDTPLALQLAVQGSRSKVNSTASVQLMYQGIDENRTFDIINLNSYDLILGTPWMYQHKICLGFNPARVVIGSDNPQPIKTGSDTKLMVHSMSPLDQDIEKAREELRRYAEPLCKEVHETDLPPFQAINHTIPLIDEEKTYPWRPSRCPDAFRAQWAEKRNAYIKSGRWKVTSAGNTVPMLLIPKPGTNPPELRTVVDLRERNKNTSKQTSPLPDMEGMLRRTASKPFRTALDLKSAYEQIRIVPEHVGRSTVTTPDGNMVSQVIQIGDCNAPATYQALMNHLFSAYIGRFMDIYLDDIVIYSNTLTEHVGHVKTVLDILIREKLYLSRSKLRFIANELKILGRIIDDEGIRMDAEKVDSILNWKIPTNRDLLRGFIGSVGYLADDIPNVRIPMGVLSAITGDTVPFRWGYTEQRAFDEVKALVHHAREHRRVPLDYLEGAPTIWMITDGCSTGISGLISQGNDWRTAKVAAFYSAKLNSAQQDYPVHEIEMFAGTETMLRHVDILQGAKFKWLTDHKGLIYLLNQKNLSGRQARWLEKTSSFTFEVVYIPGSKNVVADALSRIYSNDSSGTVRAKSEFTAHDVIDDDTIGIIPGTGELPVLAGIEARIATRHGSRVRRPTEKALMINSEASRETSKDFASRMKDRFVLKGPQAPVGQKEGGTLDASNDSNNAPSNSKDISEDVGGGDVRPSALDASTSTERLVSAAGEHTSFLDVVSQGQQGLDLVAELRGRYGLDPAFQSIWISRNIMVSPFNVVNIHD